MTWFQETNPALVFQTGSLKFKLNCGFIMTWWMDWMSRPGYQPEDGVKLESEKSESGERTYRIPYPQPFAEAHEVLT